jgi:hypothetical protein
LQLCQNVRYLLATRLLLGVCALVAIDGVPDYEDHRQHHKSKDQKASDAKIAHAQSIAHSCATRRAHRRKQNSSA